MRPIKILLLFIFPVFANSQELSFALEQIDGRVFIEEGLTGKGVKIGIIDGGFLNANQESSLANHFEDGRVKWYKDFITPDLKPYGGSKGQDDGHGTKVWEQIGGINPETKVQFGLATQAWYYLARTDHYVYERRAEERYMIQALAEMIAQGVRIVNISLGYTNGYSRRSENYQPEQMDGKTAWVTKAMDSLLSSHDVLVITSAGNDGDNRWQTLSAPSDSENVLSVGATKGNLIEEMKYSSRGLGVLGYVKPEIACFSTSGTSFSAPVITGLAACLLELEPNLTAKQLKDLLMKSSSLYPFANNYMGYGSPSAVRLLALVKGEERTGPKEVETAKSKMSFQSGLPKSDKQIRSIAYHKIDGWKVVKKEIIRSRSRVTVKRYEQATQTTVLVGGTDPIEIFWKE